MTLAAVLAAIVVASTDGRVAQIGITRRGRDLLARMWPVYAAAIDTHLGAQITRAELRQLARLLGKIPKVAR